MPVCCLNELASFSCNFLDTCLGNLMLRVLDIIFENVMTNAMAYYLKHLIKSGQACIEID